MKMIIVGRNRVQISTVKLKTWENKRWFVTGTDQYKMPPDGFTRIIVTRYGHRLKDEEGIVTHEGALAPYHCRNQDYSINRLLMEVRAHKTLASNGKGKVDLKKIIAKGKVRSWMRELAASGPTVLVMIIVLWALIF